MEGEGSWKELFSQRRGRLFSNGFAYHLAMRAPFRKSLSIYQRLEKMRHRENDLYAIITSSTDGIHPRVHIDCGSEDFLIEDNRAFHTSLTEKAVDHEYREYLGAHDWSYWNARMTELINFHARSLNIIK